MHLTGNAIEVLSQRYLIRSESGSLLEKPDQLILRVSKAIAKVEKKNRQHWEKKFFEIQSDLRFLPNSPTLMNAGKKGGQLSACFVLPVLDDLEAIFDTLKNAALIHQSGGGTGFSFSRLRSAGTLVSSSAGSAAGPLGFMKIFDAATDAIKQGGVRRGANMGVLRVDHPDIAAFIELKKNAKELTNFNISVGITDEFMRCLEEDRVFALRDPRTKVEVTQIKATTLFDRLVKSAWQCGDPGLIFLDRINQFNPTPKEGAFESTNPCGEQPLLPFESCNLGSMNLSKYVVNKQLMWGRFEEDIETCVRFLDNVIDANHFPVRESKVITLKNRKIGLGVMGFADALLKLEIPYDSEEAQKMGEKIMATLNRGAKKTSAALAKEKGAFPNWKDSVWKQLGYSKLRNATVSTVAPTGTISILAGASSGIEPIYSGIYYRNVLAGGRLLEIHPAVEELLNLKPERNKNLSEEQIAQHLGQAWRPAQKVSIESHVKMQAAFQRHSDSAVSKTINLPQSASEADVAVAYRLAYGMGCKGITVYRDKSRESQVLETQEHCDVCNE